MGNKLCKKKQDAAEGPKSPTPFDRIINRLHVSEFVHYARSHGEARRTLVGVFLVSCKHTSLFTVDVRWCK